MLARAAHGLGRATRPPRLGRGPLLCGAASGDVRQHGSALRGGQQPGPRGARAGDRSRPDKAMSSRSRRMSAQRTFRSSAAHANWAGLGGGCAQEAGFAKFGPTTDSGPSRCELRQPGEGPLRPFGPGRTGPRSGLYRPLATRAPRGIKACLHAAARAPDRPPRAGASETVQAAVMSELCCTINRAAQSPLRPPAVGPSRGFAHQRDRPHRPHSCPLHFRPRNRSGPQA